MKSYSKVTWLLSGGVLQLMPLFLQAQATPIAPPVVAPPSLVSGIKGAIPPPVESKPGSDLSKPPSVIDRITDILDFWFGALPGPDFLPDNKMPIWFASTPEIDRQIRDNFSQDVMNAERGDYNSWREIPRGRLALILLLDQFPRHIYRDRPQAFRLDRMARALTLEGIQRGVDQELHPIERAFFYLPLEHSEDPGIQNLSIASYRQLVAQSPESIQPQMHDFLQAAITHQQQIARFGRFPYRNPILGRESTPEETVFLMQWGRR